MGRLTIKQICIRLVITACVTVVFIVVMSSALIKMCELRAAMPSDGDYISTEVMIAIGTIAVVLIVAGGLFTDRRNNEGG